MSTAAPTADVPAPLFLTQVEVMALLRVSRSKLYSLRALPGFPAAVRLGDGPYAPLRWNAKQLGEWMAKRASR